MTQFYKLFMESESFRRFVGDMGYDLTSPQEGEHGGGAGISAP